MSNEKITALIAGLRFDAGDFGKGMRGELEPGDLLSWNQRQVRAWEAADALEASVQEPAVDREALIEEEARKRHPVDHEVDDPSGATGVARSDPYGYEDTARQAFIEGAKFALEASVQAPAVDREAMAEVLFIESATEGPAEETMGEVGERLARAVLASGILQDAREVEARGLEKAADAARKVTANMHGGFSIWLNRRAQQVREGQHD